MFVVVTVTVIYGHEYRRCGVAFLSVLIVKFAKEIPFVYKKRAK